MTTIRKLRGALLFAASIVVGSQVVTACVDDRPEPCRTVTNGNEDSECREGFVCSSDGFCQRECRYDDQCPCGSFCAGSCGLCILDDLSGPATCTAVTLGYGSPQDAIGACRTDIRRLLAEELDANAASVATADGAADAEPAPDAAGDGSGGGASSDRTAKRLTGQRWSCRFPLGAPVCTNADAETTSEAGEDGQADDSGQAAVDAETPDDGGIEDASLEDADAGVGGDS